MQGASEQKVRRTAKYVELVERAETPQIGPAVVLYEARR